MAEAQGGQLRQRQPSCLDVAGVGAGAGVPEPQHNGQRLSGPSASVWSGRHSLKPEGLLLRRRNPILFRKGYDHASVLTSRQTTGPRPTAPIAAIASAASQYRPGNPLSGIATPKQQPQVGLDGRQVPARNISAAICRVSLPSCFDVADRRSSEYRRLLRPQREHLRLHLRAEGVAADTKQWSGVQCLFPICRQ